MSFFKNPEVDAKYKSLVPDGRDPKVTVVISHDGPFSEISLPIADRMLANGDAIALKKEEKAADTQKKTEVQK